MHDFQRNSKIPQFLWETGSHPSCSYIRYYHHDFVLKKFQLYFRHGRSLFQNKIWVSITHSVEHKKCKIWKRKCISFVRELCDWFKKWLIWFKISFVINLWKLCQVSWMLGKYQRNREIWCFSPHSKRTLNRVINGISKEMTLVVSLFH